MEWDERGSPFDEVGASLILIYCCEFVANLLDLQNSFDGRSFQALRTHSQLRRLRALSGELTILLRNRHHQ